MDPKQTLLYAEQAYSDAKYGDAIEYLAHYYNWRLTGGFEPKGLPIYRVNTGDKFADYLMYRLATAVRAVSITD